MGRMKHEAIKQFCNSDLPEIVARDLQRQEVMKN